MTEQEYESLEKQWQTLDAKRDELLARHDPEGQTCFEEESWYPEYQAIEQQLDKLDDQLVQYEECEMADSDSREFLSPVVDGEVRSVGDFAWDHWQKWATADGVPEDLADLGRAVIREAYQHNWPEELKAECGWSDDGAEMILLATSQPDRARIRWRYLIESDGDFWWCS